MKQKLKNKKGFTLVELLVVVAIIAVLVVISVPMVSRSLDEAQQAADDANMRTAKAVATIEYLTADNAPTGKKYFDAESGTLTDATPTPYGQVNDNTNNVISVTFSGDAEPQYTWEAGKTGG